ncbi:uncharacterized protein MYCFIDRAFT_164467 [Pseudocercospora fijiensis CIRAD86]|uniref:Uncharacterized protein n=1 Tax=Pseudocercospora fijiensis (strain CIRAD86) TaxID=383855 RepID=M2ZWD2_PSEFD|nr:uncharacterized protein MYCFIDRAFT_164467 [Pseudocercospora fijiensis CIRAD86]EME83294.1 hypothetical protein MYCFIDRAFT_164467 [Pseudocercospora fijiensis CIRAD86]
MYKDSRLRHPGLRRSTNSYETYQLYRPRRASHKSTSAPRKPKFHPVRSTLFILVWSLTAFLVAFTITLYIARTLQKSYQPTNVIS